MGGLCVLAVIEAPVRGWASATTLALGAIGALCLGAFVRYEARRRDPLLDVRILTQPGVGAAVLALFLIFLADFGLIFLIFQFEALILGMGAVLAATGFMPGLVSLGPLAPLSPRLATRHGLRAVMVVALTLCGLGCLAGAFLLQSPDYWPVAVVMILFWAGMGLGMGPMTEAILDGVPQADQGVASALNDLARELGATVGIALMGSTFNSGYRGAISQALGELDPALHEAVRASPNAALEVGGDLGVRAGLALKGDIMHAFFVGTELTFFVAAGICVLGAGVVGWLLRETADHRLRESDLKGAVEAAVEESS